MTRHATLKSRIQPNHLGEMVRLFRTVNQITLRDMAVSIGISHPTLMRIEHGQSFDADTLIKIWTWLISPLPPEDQP